MKFGMYCKYARNREAAVRDHTEATAGARNKVELIRWENSVE
jgi:hypothetical protein